MHDVFKMDLFIVFEPLREFKKLSFIKIRLNRFLFSIAKSRLELTILNSLIKILMVKLRPMIHHFLKIRAFKIEYFVGFNFN